MNSLKKYVSPLVLACLFIFLSACSSDESLDSPIPNNYDASTEESVPEPDPTPEPIAEDEIEEPTPIPEDTESLILLADYAWMDPTKSEATIALQEFLEIEADGWYGIGTRSAHLAALEERGLPNDNVPTCDLTVGEELCGVQEGTPMENALATLIAGMGEPDNQSEWSEICGYNHKSYSWGSVTASFREGPDQKAYAFWSIINRFTESEGWQDPFPSEIKFTGSKLVTWPEEDHRLTPRNPDTGDIAASAITNNLVPSGEHLEPYLEDFETNVGYSLQYDTMWGFNLLYTDNYKVIYGEYTPTGDSDPELVRLWRWVTDELQACD